MALAAVGEGHRERPTLLPGAAGSNRRVPGRSPSLPTVASLAAGSAPGAVMTRSAAGAAAAGPKGASSDFWHVVDVRVELRRVLGTKADEMR